MVRGRDAARREAVGRGHLARRSRPPARSERVRVAAARGDHRAAVAADADLPGPWARDAVGAGHARQLEGAWRAPWRASRCRPDRPRLAPLDDRDRTATRALPRERLTTPRGAASCRARPRKPRQARRAVWTDRPRRQLAGGDVIFAIPVRPNVWSESAPPVRLW